MWLFLGILACIATVLNVYFSFLDKNAKYFRFAALALTALTMCSVYSAEAMRVVEADWEGLLDTMPTMSKGLWICVILSIILNSISLFREK